MNSLVFNKEFTRGLSQYKFVLQELKTNKGKNFLITAATISCFVRHLFIFSAL
jgi:hypothetical protein